MSERMSSPPPPPSEGSQGGLIEADGMAALDIPTDFNGRRESEVSHPGLNNTAFVLEVQDTAKKHASEVLLRSRPSMPYSEGISEPGSRRVSRLGRTPRRSRSGFDSARDSALLSARSRSLRKDTTMRVSFVNKGQGEPKKGARSLLGMMQMASSQDRREGGELGKILPQRKKTWFFGYLPSFTEIIPGYRVLDRGEVVKLTPDMTTPKGMTQCDLIAGNIITGVVTGLKMLLAAVVYANLIFNGKGTSGKGKEHLEAAFGPGIFLMLWTSIVASLWNSFFGRLQYSVAASRIVPAVLLSQIASDIADDPSLQETPEKMVPTLLFCIALTTTLLGVVFLIVGKLRAGDMVLYLPSPVTGGFLGSVGWAAMRSAIRTASGVPWYNPAKDVGRWWPERWTGYDGFFGPDSIVQVVLTLVAVILMRNMPALCKQKIPYLFMHKFWSIIWTVFPLVVFYIVVAATQTDLNDLRQGGVFDDAPWVYAKIAEGNGTTDTIDFFAFWEQYDFDMISVPAPAIPKLVLLLLMSLVATLLTMAGTISAFPQGHPDGDPDQYSTMDYSQEITSLGAANLLVGLSGGMGVYHVIGFTLDNRNDGGTHRLSTIIASVCLLAIFFSGFNLAPYFPRFFLAGIFFNMGFVLFNNGVVAPLESLGVTQNFTWRTPSFKKGFFRCCTPTLSRGLQEWTGTAVCLLVTIFTQLIYGIAASIAFAFFLYIYQTSRTVPLQSLSTGLSKRSSRKRPGWEAHALGEVGGRLVILEMKNDLFFGTVKRLSDVMEKIIATNLDDNDDNDLEYVIMDFALVSYMDGSASKRLRILLAQGKRCGVRILFSGLNDGVLTAMISGGIVKPKATTLHTQPDADDTFKAGDEVEVMLYRVWFNARVVTANDDGTYDVELVSKLGTAKMDIEESVPAHCLRRKVWPDRFDTLDDAIDWVEESLLDDYYYKEKRKDAWSIPQEGERELDIFEFIKDWMWDDDSQVYSQRLQSVENSLVWEVAKCKSDLEYPELVEEWLVTQAGLWGINGQQVVHMADFLKNIEEEALGLPQPGTDPNVLQWVREQWESAQECGVDWRVFVQKTPRNLLTHILLRRMRATYELRYRAACETGEALPKEAHAFMLEMSLSELEALRNDAILLEYQPGDVLWDVGDVVLQPPQIRSGETVTVIADEMVGRSQQADWSNAHSETCGMSGKVVEVEVGATEQEDEQETDTERHVFALVDIEGNALWFAAPNLIRSPEIENLASSYSMCFIQRGQVDTVIPEMKGHGQMPDTPLIRFSRQNAGNGVGEAQFVQRARHACKTFVSSSTPATMVVVTDGSWQAIRDYSPQLYTKLLEMLVNEMAEDNAAHLEVLGAGTYEKSNFNALNAIEIPNGSTHQGRPSITENSFYQRPIKGTEDAFLKTVNG